MRNCVALAALCVLCAGLTVGLSGCPNVGGHKKGDGHTVMYHAGEDARDAGRGVIQGGRDFLQGWKENK